MLVASFILTYVKRVNHSWLLSDIPSIVCHTVLCSQADGKVDPQQL